MRSCGHCGAPIPADLRAGTKYCSTRCRSDAGSLLKSAGRLDNAGARICAYCGSPIPTRKRADSKYCSPTCRRYGSRYAWRLDEDVRRLEAPVDDQLTTGLNLVIAGPASKPVSKSLLACLRRFDGWALRLPVNQLVAALALCSPDEVRVAACVRKKKGQVGRWPVNNWEPVIYHPARDASRVDAREPSRPAESDASRQPGDVLLHSRARGTNPTRWIASQLLGAMPGDQLTTMYPDPARTATV